MEEYEKLILKAKNNDKDAFTKLILNIEQNLYNIAKTRLKSEEDINDAMQETEIIAFRSIKKLEQPQYFKAWIIKILINECNKIYNKNTKHFNIFKKITKNKDIIGYDDGYINNIENKIELEKIFDFLNYDEKLAILLHYKEKYTIAQISEILNANQNTIRSRIARAKEKLSAYNKGGAINEKTK